MYTANQIADWFLTSYSAKMDMDDGIDPMTQMKLHKLLYYAQGTFLAVHGEPLFSDELFHWKHGPVVKEIYYRFKGKTIIGENITDEERKNYSIVESDTDAEEVLDAVFINYSDYSAAQLRNMTHRESPWKDTARDDIIPKENIQQYFKDEIVEM